MRLLFLLLCPLSHLAVAQSVVKNTDYRLEKQGDRLLIERRGTGVKRTIRPAVRVFFSAKTIKPVYERTRELPYPVLGWKAGNAKPTTNLGAVTDTIDLRVSRIEQEGNGFRIQFAPHPVVTVSARISLPEGAQMPLIELQLTANRDGQLAGSFTGWPAYRPQQLDFLYQPLMWSWKRFPQASYWTPESYCTTAASFVSTDGATEGIAPDPSEIPYRFATLENSRFALSLRTAGGLAQPALLFPVPGNPESNLKKGQTVQFKQRYFLHKGDWQQGLTYLLRTLFRYRSERQNGAVSLNQTFDNMLNLAMHDFYGGWVAELKGSDYQFDVPGSVKNVSALHPLSLALITGNEEIYRRRAVPMMTYMMSREKFLYAIEDKVQHQNPSHFLKGPCVDVGELAALHQMTNGQSPAFVEEMNRLFGKTRKLNLETETGGGSWQDYLARYRVTAHTGDLAKAREGAERYLSQMFDRYSETFLDDPGLKDKQAAFATDFGYRIYDLFELYEATRELRYLRAATVGARQLLLWTRSNPITPDSVMLANPGGRVAGVFPGKRLGNTDYGFTPMDMTTEVAEQRVPAWQTSLVGLLPEQPGTYQYGPVMLAHHAAWLLRLAHLSGDSLLADAARNAVIGRYANFPGYYFTSLQTTVYQQPDYPMHPYIDVKYNATFYNHIWPHLALLMDFLVSDFYHRTGGKIDFPSVYAPGYAFLTSKVYGHQPGRFPGEEGVRLWMPTGAIQSATTALNYLFGIKGNDTYLALANTTGQPVRETIRLNPSVIPWNAGQTYAVTVYTAQGAGRQIALTDGQLTVDLPAGGWVAYRITNLPAQVPLFRKLADRPTATPVAKRFVRQATDSPVWGTTTAMVLQTLPQFADFFLFSDRTEKDWQSVQMRYRIGTGAWKTINDTRYPFEFDVHLPNPAEPITWQLTVTNRQGGQTTGPETTLNKPE